MAKDKSTNQNQNVDPYALDIGEIDNLQNSIKFKSVGVVCPKRMGTGNCAVCPIVSDIYNSKDKFKIENIAVKKSAKANFFMNIVLSSRPDEVRILEVGKNAGTDLLDGIKNRGWRDITHPSTGKGREMMITKRKGDGEFANYPVSPVLDKADWDVPQSVLDNLPNLDKIEELLNDDSKKDLFMKISSLKMDETLQFRICPPWNREYNKKPMMVLWRHWGGVTKDEVDGKVPVNISISSTVTEEAPKTMLDDAPFDLAPTDGAKTVNSEQPLGCFGKSVCYDPTDDDCTKCIYFKACGKKIAKSAI